MRKYAVVLTLGATIAFGGSQLAEGQSNPVPQAPPAGAQAEVQCQPMKVVYSEKRWERDHPAKGVRVCPSKNGRAIRSHFWEYRRYRSIARMKCLPGDEGWFVSNPGSCTTLVNESGLSWHAKNPDSGAEWVYQLLGGHTYPCDGFVRRLRCETIDGGPDPDTFLGRLMNHEIAAQLSRSAWTAAG